MIVRRAVALLVAIAVTAGCSGDDDGPRGAADERNPRTAATLPRSDAAGALSVDVVDDDGEPALRIAVDPPSDAVEMQVGTDPSFVTTPWEPVDDEVRRRTDGGYQEVFARFRTSPDAEPSGVVVAGADVDPAAGPATSDDPAPTSVGLSDPRTVTVTVEAGRVRRGVDGDDDRVVGPDVDGTSLDDGWKLAGPDGPVRIVRTERSTRPSGAAHAGRDGGDISYSTTHRVDLLVGEAIEVGERYTLRSPLGTTTRFTIDDRATRSPAVHANQVGYRPSDVGKRAFLTAPYGTNGMEDPVTFRVVTLDGDSVLDGTADEVATPADEVGRGDLTGSRVWRLDFGAVTTPGRYRVCADGIGCSASFSIGEDDTWARVARTVARGLFHQRSGIALGAPYTPVTRPRPDHPDDGLEVLQSSLTALEASEMLDDELFERLVEGSTGEVVDDAWGGHFDAGDWDRRAQHLWVAREAFDLLRIAPDRFAALDLNLPESGDAIPDVADEALWTLDLFRRLQRDDGSVGGGVESARFPDRGTPSWRDDLRRYAYAPDPWTTFAYASVAADASVALRDVDPERSRTYAESATAAMEWALDAPVPDGFDEKVSAQRAVAAASMLAMDGDARWNEEFLDATPFAAGSVDVLGCGSNEICDAAWNYLWVDPSLTDPTAVANIVASFASVASRIATAADTTTFGWCLEDPGVPLIWGLGVGGAPRAMTLLRAWLLSGDEELLAHAQRCASVSLGANPLDRSYVTGVGANPPRHPLIVDTFSGGLPVWPGTPVYGPHQIGRDEQWVIDHRLQPAGTTGDLHKIPYLRSWFDLGDVGPMNEFTVFQSHGPALWVYGVLASGAPTRPSAAPTP